VIARLCGRIRFGRDAPLELVNEPLPITNRLEMIQTLRKIHEFLGAWPDKRSL
jgi:hypothetical protein